jgi:hypothetical protein
MDRRERRATLRLESNDRDRLAVPIALRGDAQPGALAVTDPGRVCANIAVGDGRYLTPRFTLTNSGPGDATICSWALMAPTWSADITIPPAGLPLASGATQGLVVTHVNPMLSAPGVHFTPTSDAPFSPAGGILLWARQGCPPM